MRRAVLGMLCIAAASACTLRQPERAVVQVTGPPPTSEEILGSVAARRRGIQSLRTLARLRYVSPQDKRRTKQVLVVARPDRLRCEVLSPFGPVFIFTSTGGVFAAYASAEHTVYRGDASPGNLERYISLQLPVADAVDLLLGTPPVLPDGQNRVSQEDGYWKLWQGGSHGAYVTWFAAGLDPVRHEQLDEGGHVLLRATFADFTEADGYRLPAQLAIELPPAQQRLELTLTEMEINPVLADALFVLATPAGSKEIDLDRVVH